MEYDKDSKGRQYKSICPKVSTNIKYSDPCRKKEVHIGRPRLGVSLTNHSLFKIGKHPNGLCDTCQVQDTIQHLLLECERDNIASLLKDQCNIYKSEFNLNTLLKQEPYKPQSNRPVARILF